MPTLQADRIDFLAHLGGLPHCSRTIDRQVRPGLLDPADTAPRTGAKAFHDEGSYPRRPRRRYSRSTSSWWLFSALAIADCSTFFTSPEIRRRRESDSVGQRLAGVRLPADRSRATTFSFCGLDPHHLGKRLRASSVGQAPALRDGFTHRLTSSSPACRPRGRNRCGSVRKLSELVADHVLGDQHRNRNFSPVVDTEGQADELRQDRRPTRPRS